MKCSARHMVFMFIFALKRRLQNVGGCRGERANAPQPTGQKKNPGRRGTAARAISWVQARDGGRLEFLA